MPRTLPWLKSGSSTSTARATATSPTTNTTRQPAPKRRRISTSPTLDASSDMDLDELDDDDNELPTNPTSASTPSRRRLLKSTRTPSTSPPPAPPDLVPMREGYNEDDIWMMVEDEFYSIAQAYTQHLHHAEYQRLKLLAKERENANESRGHGTDGRSKMSAGGARALAREAREKNVGNALKKLGQGDDEDDDDIEDDDPWLGTQLAGLMTSPRKAQRLRAKGMGQGRSDTRAARGFARSDQSAMPSQRQRRVSFDKDPTTEPSPSARKSWISERNVEQQETTDDGDSDDLDAPSRSRTVKPQRVPSKSVHLGTNDRVKEARSSASRTTDSTHEPSRTPWHTENIDSFHKANQRPSPDRQRTHATAGRPRSTTDGTGTRQRAASPPKSILRKPNIRDSDSSSTMCASLSSSTTVEAKTGSFLSTQTTEGGVSKFARRRAEREKARLEREKRESQESATSITEIPTFLF